LQFPQKNLWLIFDEHTTSDIQTVDLRDEQTKNGTIIDIQYYSDWATIMTYATLTPYEHPLFTQHILTHHHHIAAPRLEFFPPNIGVVISMPRNLLDI
jgi:hypothetical protein